MDVENIDALNAAELDALLERALDPKVPVEVFYALLERIGRHEQAAAEPAAAGAQALWQLKPQEAKALDPRLPDAEAQGGQPQGDAPEAAVRPQWSPGRRIPQHGPPPRLMRTAAPATPPAPPALPPLPAPPALPTLATPSAPAVPPAPARGEEAAPAASSAASALSGLSAQRAQPAQPVPAPAPGPILTPKTTPPPAAPTPVTPVPATSAPAAPQPQPSPEPQTQPQTQPRTQQQSAPPVPRSCDTEPTAVLRAVSDLDSEDPPKS